MTDFPNFEAGTLVLWKDYTTNTFPEPQVQIGLILRYIPDRDSLIVINEGVEVEWLRWQCERIEKCK